MKLHLEVGERAGVGKNKLTQERGRTGERKSRSPSIHWGPVDHCLDLTSLREDIRIFLVQVQE